MKTLFDRLFSKKDEIETELEVPEPENGGLLGDAERVAAAVSAGLDGGDYAAMGTKLVELASAKRQTYVFKQTGTVGRVLIIVVAALLLIAFGRALFIGVGTAVLSGERLVEGLSIALIACLGLLLNVHLIIRSSSFIRRNSRLEEYSDVLRYRGFVFVEDLVPLSRKTDQVVVEDLKQAVEQKYIPQGHFNSDNLVFMTSNVAYDAYQENPAAFDRYFKKKLEERARVEGRTEEVQRILCDGARYVEKFKNYSALIKDKGISKKINEVRKITDSIFREIELDPDWVRSMNAFLNIYLPTIERLLDAYMNLEEKRAFGENVSKTKREIENALDAAIVAFGAILEGLHQEQEEGVASDIMAMETSMRQECLPTQ